MGVHTLRHDILTRPNDEQLAHALADGRAGPTKVAGCPIDTIAYPHDSFDSLVVEAARNSGFVAGLTYEEEAVPPASDLLALGCNGGVETGCLPMSVVWCESRWTLLSVI